MPIIHVSLVLLQIFNVYLLVIHSLLFYKLFIMHFYFFMALLIIVMIIIL